VGIELAGDLLGTLVIFQQKVEDKRELSERGAANRLGCAT
jgi:hypothetical protein